MKAAYALEQHSHIFQPHRRPINLHMRSYRPVHRSTAGRYPKSHLFEIVAIVVLASALGHYLRGLLSTPMAPLSSTNAVQAEYFWAGFHRSAPTTAMRYLLPTQ